jgi:dihydrofolate reductase
LVDDVQVGIVPVLFGRGKRLFEDGGTDRIELERVRVIETDVDTDIRFRVRGGQRGPL